VSVTEEAAASLDQVIAAILAAVNDDRTFNQIWGWNLPPLTRHDITEILARTAKRIRSFEPSSLPEDAQEVLSKVPERAKLLRAKSLPQITSANAPAVVQQIEQLAQWIEDGLPPPPPPKISIDWKEPGNKGLLPPDLLRRLRSLEASLKQIEPRAAKVREQVQTINDAHAAAESLPTDLQTLEEARAGIDSIQAAISDASKEASEGLSAVQSSVAKISSKEGEATKLLENLEDAYRATTTKGLAASFSQRAFWLNISVGAWVGGLLGALILGSMIATARFASVEQTLAANGDVSADRLWVQIILALVGVGAPVWFAWIATKQIGQRFRLAEDYGYKASVAKAYEGYRREAARLDPAFEARLFGSALTRLDEAPLRLVEHQSYGSPWHELTSSAQFQNALEAVPELKDKYLAIAQSSAASLVGSAKAIGRGKSRAQKAGANAPTEVD
jgi:hypothetical protein